MTFAPRWDVCVVGNTPLLIDVVLTAWDLVFAYFVYVFLMFDGLEKRRRQIDVKLFGFPLYRIYLITISELIETWPSKIMNTVSILIILGYTFACFDSAVLGCFKVVLYVSLASVMFTSFRLEAHMYAAMPFMVLVWFTNACLCATVSFHRAGIPNWVWIFLFVVETLALIKFGAYPLFYRLTSGVKTHQRFYATLFYADLCLTEFLALGTIYVTALLMSSRGAAR
jgi:hypothetical protein